MFLFFCFSFLFFCYAVHFVPASSLDANLTYDSTATFSSPARAASFGSAYFEVGATLYPAADPAYSTFTFTFTLRSQGQADRACAARRRVLLRGCSAVQCRAGQGRAHGARGARPHPLRPAWRGAARRGVTAGHGPLASHCRCRPLRPATTSPPIPPGTVRSKSDHHSAHTDARRPPRSRLSASIAILIRMCDHHNESAHSCKQGSRDRPGGGGGAMFVRHRPDIRYVLGT